MRIPVLLAGLFAVSTLVHADPVFKPFEADYVLHKGSVKAATSKIKLSVSGNQYEYSRQGSTAGLVSMFSSIAQQETSEFTLTAQGQIQVSEYHQQQTKGGKKTKKSTSILFDWTKRIAVHTKKGQSHNVALGDEALDPFAVELAMMRDLKKSHQLPTYSIVDSDKIVPYKFEILGEESVTTPAGTFTTLKIKRERENKKRTTYIWAAPKLGYLPVKVEHVEKDGSSFSSVLTRVSGLP